MANDASTPRMTVRGLMRLPRDERNRIFAAQVDTIVDKVAQYYATDPDARAWLDAFCDYYEGRYFDFDDDDIKDTPERKDAPREGIVAAGDSDA